jgi:hypothetical protein
MSPHKKSPSLAHIWSLGSMAKVMKALEKKLQNLNNAVIQHGFRDNRLMHSG